MSQPTRHSPLDALLEEARPLERTPDAVRAALRTRLFETLELGAPLAPVSSAVEELSPPATSSWRPSRLLWTASLAAGLGFGAGWVAHDRLAPPPVPPGASPSNTQAAPPPHPLPPTPPSPPKENAAPRSPRVEPRPEGAKRNPAPSEERLLLEQARTALMKGRADDAALALKALEERFPHGGLREERMAFQVQRYLLAGDAEGARQALQRFSAEFPQSPLRAPLEAAVRGK